MGVSATGRHSMAQQQRKPVPSGGHCIAFVRCPGADRGELLVTDPEGADVRRLDVGPGSRGVWGPAWSPDGWQLCCVRLAGDYSALFVIDFSGLPPRRLTAPSDADEDSPVWSPDGAHIAFVHSNRHGADHLRRVHVASGTVRRLTTGPGLDGAPSWSPDGRRLVFHRALGDPSGLYILPAEGGPARFLTPGLDPDWGPDNRRIAYSQGGLLWVIRVCEGGEVDGPPRQLTGDPRVEDRHPSWSPDGSRIVFSRGPADGDHAPPHLIVLDTATGKEQDIGDGQEPDWGPQTLSTRGPDAPHATATPAGADPRRGSRAALEDFETHRSGGSLRRWSTRPWPQASCSPTETRGGCRTRGSAPPAPRTSSRNAWHASACELRPPHEGRDCRIIGGRV